ncbi:MAG: GAF domain-containing sensor histidine kinase [Deltaproteobacteria bacterium]|nr:GAF domain-containing sensor histidine kinase [Deltaproteobacteria bacterium]
MSPLALIGYPLCAVAAMNLSLAMFLVARRRNQGPLQPYAASLAFINTVYCLVMGLAYVRASIGLEYDLLYRSAWIGWVGLAPLAQIVFTLQGKPRLAFWVGVALYVLWGTILVLCVTTDLVEIGAVSLLPFVDRVGPFEQQGRMLGALTLLYLLVGMVQVHRASSGRKRQQTSYFLLGLAFYATAGLLLAGVLQFMVHISFDPGLVGYFSLGWMAATVYAIRQHRLFDIQIVLSRVGEALILGVLLVIANVILFRSLSPLLGSSTAVWVASVVSALLLFLSPLIPILRRASAVLLARRRLDFMSALKELTQALARLTTVDEVVHVMVEVARNTVGTDCAGCFLREEGAFLLKVACGKKPIANELAADSPLVRRLSANPQVLVTDELDSVEQPESSGGEVVAELRRFGVAVAAPIAHQGELRGILMLGAKRDRDAFLQGDVDFLETLALEAAVALENAGLLEERQVAVEARDEFLSVAGHELRTPLTAMQINVQSLLKRELPPENMRERLVTTERLIARMTRLTNQLLDVSRITANRLVLEREPVDLTDVVREVASRLEDERKRSGSALDLHLAESVPGSWDRLRLEQVVTNLLGNAIKYGKGQPIEVETCRSPTEATLIVRDHGIGIAPEDQKRIFERFERAISKHHYGGFGLGLWITRQAVEAHGGRVQVTSAPGTGACFSVVLPLSLSA